MNRSAPMITRVPTETDLRSPNHRENEEGRVLRLADCSSRTVALRLAAVLLVFLCCHGGAGILRSADLSIDWRFEQSLVVSQAGLLKVSLPAETLGTARSELEDLRLTDPAGREVPYVLERSQAAGIIEQRARSFTASLSREATVLLIETGVTAPIDRVELLTPASDFIKSVTVEGSTDRQTWQVLIREVPVFRQAGGLTRLGVPLPKVSFRWLRITVDDRRSAPVPFTGATLFATPAETPSETVTATMIERVEDPPESRLRLALPATHWSVASIDLEVADPVFSREVTVHMRNVVEGTVRETRLAQGTIYRLAFDEVGAVSHQTVRVEKPVTTRELILVIDNQDSPPLTIPTIRLRWRPIYLVFRAAEVGTYRLWLGNNLCAAPRYDVAALSANLRAVPNSPIRPSAVRTNANYRPPTALPAVADTAAPLNTAAWKYRSPVVLAGPGAQQLELSLPVLAHAQAGLEDLRLLRGTNQVPFVLETAFARRLLSLEVQAEPDPKRPQVSRWRLTVPHAPLPLTRLTCVSATPLFERLFALHEERADERGERYRISLGSVTWRQTRDRPTSRSRSIWPVLHKPTRCGSRQTTATIHRCN